jgi:dipeptidyl aminopeptidase/acylaminoacyl peptidase
VKAENLPVVVNPHGGPWARDSWGFNPEVQFLANRGYAVLQMNFRGSTGYGRKFWEASFKQWGRTMQDDITDGVKWLISQGIADSTRIAIYGVSYGVQPWPGSHLP